MFGVKLRFIDVGVINETKTSTRNRNAGARFCSLLSTSGGPYTTETLIHSVGPGLGLLILALVPADLVGAGSANSSAIRKTAASKSCCGPNKWERKESCVTKQTSYNVVSSI
jgi:hypothetical protein